MHMKITHKRNAIINNMKKCNNKGAFNFTFPGFEDIRIFNVVNISILSLIYTSAIKRETTLNMIFY